MKQTITNKNGTTFERKMKPIIYDTRVWCRYKTENSNKLDKIAKQQGITTSTLIRNILDEYLERVDK